MDTVFSPSRYKPLGKGIPYQLLHGGSFLETTSKATGKDADPADVLEDNLWLATTTGQVQAPPVSGATLKTATGMPESQADKAAGNNAPAAGNNAPAAVAEPTQATSAPASDPVPAPKLWQEYRTSTGIPYWYNTETKLSTWEAPPSDEEHEVVPVAPAAAETASSAVTPTSVVTVAEQLRQAQEAAKQALAEKRRELEELEGLLPGYGHASGAEAAAQEPEPNTPVPPEPPVPTWAGEADLHRLAQEVREALSEARAVTEKLEAELSKLELLHSRPAQQEPASRPARLVPGLVGGPVVVPGKGAAFGFDNTFEPEMRPEPPKEQCCNVPLPNVVEATAVDALPQSSDSDWNINRMIRASVLPPAEVNRIQYAQPGAIVS